MAYFMGIDGGGTSTDFALFTQEGECAATLSLGPCRPGKPLEGALLREGVSALLLKAGVEPHEVRAAAFGMPGYGEYGEEDTQARALAEAVCAPIPLYLCNDVEVGHAAALGLMPGISVVSGTGSIAFAKDEQGTQARAGGWWSNLGSGWWLGRRTVDSFLKMNDGILPKTALYAIIRRAFGLKEKEDIFAYTVAHLQDDRTNLAAVQLWLNEAADAGDEEALSLYREAAEELAQLVKGCYNQLRFTGVAGVSYTGSVFKAGDKLLGPFTEALDPSRFAVRAPLYAPVAGAVLLAASRFCPDALDAMLRKMDKLGG